MTMARLPRKRSRPLYVEVFTRSEDGSSINTDPESYITEYALVYEHSLVGNSDVAGKFDVCLPMRPGILTTPTLER